MSPEADDRPRPEVRASRSDRWLVRHCLKGRDDAWSLLIDKYKNLIFSIPLKNGLSSDDAAEIFQSVCVSLLSELPKIRDPKALPAWLIRVTYNQCFQWRRQQEQFAATGTEDVQELADSGPAALPEDQIREVEVEQALRECVASLSPRCRQLISMLFYESPTRPYQEVAENLGLAEGSIGFIRSRCLEQLRKKLKHAGFTGS